MFKNFLYHLWLWLLGKYCSRHGIIMMQEVNGDPLEDGWFCPMCESGERDREYESRERTD